MPACPKPKKSRFDERAARQAAKVANEREVYAAVTLRDESCCRVCRKFCNPRAVGLLVKAHHHHIVYSSAGGGTTLENVCLLCAKCHNDEHQHRIGITGNADERDPLGRLCGLTIRREYESGWTSEKVG